MKASTWRGGSEFTVDDVPDPTPGPGEVLVKIDSTGICGTDVHITQGLFPSTPPKILGHEASGVVEDRGSRVGTINVGDRVVMNTTTHCDECWNCLNWSQSRCERSGTTHGFYAQYAVVPEQAAVKLPDGLDMEIAALTEPASCCLSGAEMIDPPGDGSTGLVIGGGIMGLFTTAFLKARGVEKIIMSEPVESRREMARQFGAAVLNDPTSDNLEELVRDLTNGRGVDVAAEAVGKPGLVAKCVELTRPRGQTLMIGVCPEGSPLPVDLYDMHYREIKLFGAFGRGDVFERVPQELQKLNLEGVVSGRFSLEELPQGVQDSADGKGIKFMVKPNG